LVDVVAAVAAAADDHVGPEPDQVRGTGETHDVVADATGLQQRRQSEGRREGPCQQATERAGCCDQPGAAAAAQGVAHDQQAVGSRGKDQQGRGEGERQQRSDHDREV
jgi:hypothetical protein